MEIDIETGAEPTFEASFVVTWPIYAPINVMPHYPPPENLKGHHWGINPKIMPHVRVFDILRTVRICNKYGSVPRGSAFRQNAMAVASVVESQSLAGTSSCKSWPASRVVHFESDRELVSTILRSFADVPRVASATTLVIQIKDPEWDGEFVDLKGGPGDSRSLRAECSCTSDRAVEF